MIIVHKLKINVLKMLSLIYWAMGYERIKCRHCGKVFSIVLGDEQSKILATCSLQCAMSKWNLSRIN